MSVPNTNYSVAVSHSIVFQFVTITDSIDVHYYLFNREEARQQEELTQMGEHSLDGEPVCHQEELARMVKHSLMYVRGTWIENPDYSVIKGQLIPFLQEAMCGNNYYFLILTF